MPPAGRECQSAISPPLHPALDPFSSTQGHVGSRAEGSGREGIPGQRATRGTSCHFGLVPPAPALTLIL